MNNEVCGQISPRDTWPEVQQIEHLQHALRWALSYIARGDDEPQDGDGESYEDYSGATRLAWPDNPEQWAADDSPHDDSPAGRRARGLKPIRPARNAR
jgi:hypothetical protein